MPSSPAMSATAVLAKPSRRNSASAVSMIRARVSSGLVLGWACMVSLRLKTDECHNSSVLKVKGALAVRDARRGASSCAGGVLIPVRTRSGFAGLKESERFATDARCEPSRQRAAHQIDDVNAAVALTGDVQRIATKGRVHGLPADGERGL